MANLPVLIRRARHLRTQTDLNMIRLGAVMSRIYDASNNWAASCEEVGLSMRKGYHLVNIHRCIVRRYPGSLRRLAAIGYTKLSMLTRVVEENTPSDVIEEWLVAAEQHTTIRLNRLIVGREPLTHSLKFEVTTSERRVVAQVLARFGAILSDNNIRAKTAALMTMVNEVARYGENV